MGTQQILLIVLSVIIVGIAVAVGITMFQENASNQNRQAIIADMNNFASSAMAFYKTPSSHGGAGSPDDWSTVTLDNVGNWIGYGYDTTADSLGTDNGIFELSNSAAGLKIVGVGTEEGNTTNVPLTDGPVATTDNVAATVLLDENGDITTTIEN